MEIILRPWSTYHGHFRVLSTQCPNVLRLKRPEFTLSPSGLGLAIVVKDPALGRENQIFLQRAEFCPVHWSLSPWLCKELVVLRRCAFSS